MKSERPILPVLLTALALVLTLACSPAGDTSSPEGASARVLAGDFAPVASALTPAIEAEMARHRLPALSIAVVQGGEIVWAEAFGDATAGNGAGNEAGNGAGADEIVPADLDTVYRVGSVSKLFTDLAIMQLVESGQIDLDAPVSTYLPEFAPMGEGAAEITLRQLMSHRAGLVREPPVGHYFDAGEPSLEATVASMNATTLAYPPEARSKYSNAGIAVVGYVLERLSGQPFAEALRARVLDPLGMASSSFTPTPAVREHLAGALMWGIDGREFAAPTFELGMAPAGSMYSTVGDLSQFMIAMMNDGQGEGVPVVQPATLAEMWTPQFAPAGADNGFGIGFALSRLDGHRRVGHGGAIYGFATELAMLPEEGLGVVVVTTRDFANQSTRHLADAALRAALAHRSGESIPVPEPSPPLFEDLAARIAGRIHTTPEGERVERVADLPPAAPEAWDGLIGEYGWDFDVLFILEHQGRLVALIEWFEAAPLEDLGGDRFRYPAAGLYDHEIFAFERDADGNATAVVMGIPPAGGATGVTDWGVRFPRRAVGTQAGTTFRIDPVRPVQELRPEALAADPPVEPEPEGGFREPDLVEIVDLDPSIRLDIRYATTNNFMGAVFYAEPRAFLQRPAAEALVRVHRALAQEGYGLLIHDAYRPWFVTKMFWDATPESQKQFVADPSAGSRHNRGAAVDLTLFDLATGEPVQMVGGYDEFTERSYPDYPGGTSRQRWLRELLREAMEAEGFSVYEYEWWHFDYEDWGRYPILDLTFEQVDAGPAGG